MVVKETSKSVGLEFVLQGVLASVQTCLVLSELILPVMLSPSEEVIASWPVIEPLVKFLATSYLTMLTLRLESAI